MKYLIVGLGNIGPEYHETRHNIGFMVVDAFAKKPENHLLTGDTDLQPPSPLKVGSFCY